MLELVRRGHINGVWLNKGNLAYRNTNETQGEPRLIGWMQARLLVKTFLEVDQ
jgi:hypothetical protein